MPCTQATTEGLRFDLPGVEMEVQLASGRRF